MYIQVSSLEGEGSPQSSVVTVEELKRQLAKAKERPDDELVTALRQHKEDLGEAHAAIRELLDRGVRVGADLAETHTSSRKTCMPEVSTSTSAAMVEMLIMRRKQKRKRPPSPREALVL